MQLSAWTENIVRKGEIACYKQCLLFPQCFQKLSVVYASKWGFMEERVKIILSYADAFNLNQSKIVVIW